MKNGLIIAAVALGALVVGFLVRALFWPAGEPATAPQPKVAPGVDVSKVTDWTCSMHPQIHQPKPGNCPICGMALIPANTLTENLGPRRLRVGPEAARLMDLEVSQVERRFADVTVRMVGRVAYDESRVATISAWIDGRIDRLFVDYTGIAVKKGDHMVVLYSPDLLSSQEELLQAKSAVKELEHSNIAVVRESAQRTVQAARDKLRLWGISPDKIAEIESTGKPITEFPIVAPIGGIVVEKMAKAGMYVKTGDPVYTIADLSEVWVKLDAYESDLPWVRYGQKVSFESEALLGRTFKGTLAFIDPVVDPRTRTVKVRVNVPNATGELKPDMFVHAQVHAQVTADGRVMDPDLAGKWICYMHPEIIKDHPGTCDICSMPLVRTEDLGYVTPAAGDAAKPLLVPASAPLITGKRAIVYVKVTDDNSPIFEGRVIDLGPRAGDYYVVRSGLKEGDLVVTRGNFKIDSSLQLLARGSMMSPPPENATAAPPAVKPPPAARAWEAPPAFLDDLTAVWQAYRDLWQALASDDAKLAAGLVPKIPEAIRQAKPDLLKADPRKEWDQLSTGMLDSCKAMAAGSADIEVIRRHFAVLSEQLALALKDFGYRGDKPIYRLHCPMAFNNAGANWLQDSKDTRNPYFGAQMLKCGDVTETISAGGERP